MSLGGDERLLARLGVWNPAPGGGPLVHAGGRYWPNELRRRAREFERAAAAARRCADFIEQGEPPRRLPMTKEDR